MREDILVRWLRSFPPEVLRIKGLIRLLGDPAADACFFQSTDEEWGNPSLIKTFRPEDAETCAIFIGNGMDAAKIRNSIGSYLSEASAVPPTNGVPNIGEFLDKPYK